MGLAFFKQGKVRLEGLPAADGTESQMFDATVASKITFPARVEDTSRFKNDQNCMSP